MRRTYMLLSVVVFLLLEACGGSGSTELSLQISVQPSRVSLEAGETRVFTSVISGAGDTSVTWAASGGEVSGTSSSVAYTAPALPGDYTLTVSSVANPSKTATAAIRVLSAPVEDESAVVPVDGGEIKFTQTEPWVRFLPGALKHDVHVRTRVYDDDLVFDEGQAGPIGLGAVVELDARALNLESDGEFYIAVPSSQATEAFSIAVVVLQLDDAEPHKFMANYRAGENDVVAFSMRELRTIFEVQGGVPERLRIDVQPVTWEAVGTNSVAPQATSTQTGLFKFNFPFAAPTSGSALNTLDAIGSFNCMLDSEVQEWDGWRRASSGDVDPQKTPLVLIHGWQTLSNAFNRKYTYNPALCEWLDYVSRLSRDPGVLSRYEVYSFGYNSDQRLVLSARDLRESLESVFGDREVVLLAHSMGGMVADYYIQHGGGASRVHHLTTLGTPFRGSRILICEATQGDFCISVRAIAGLTNLAYADVFRADGTRDLAWEFGGIRYPTRSHVACFLNALCIGWELSTENPFLALSNGDLIRSRYANYTAYVGTTYAAAPYSLTGPLLADYGFDSDGIVPTQSACLSASAGLDNACKDAIVGYWLPWSSDHSEIKGTATYDSVREDILRVAKELPVPGEAPGPFTLGAAAYCTPELQPAIRLSWGASAGVEAYEVYRSGTLYHELETLETTFENTTDLSAGASYTYFVRARNQAGFTNSNQVSVTAPHTCSDDPTQPTTRRVLAAGNAYSLALRNDGTVWSWGENINGQLGDGTTYIRRQPTQVLDITNITSIAAGHRHTLALDYGGTLWAWGWNWYGQLGVGGTTNQLQPTQVPELTHVTAVAAGEGHTLALRNDGTLWAWGNNSSGQLGDGSTQDRGRPAPIPDLTSVSAVTAGGYHTLALRGDGTVWAWGRNNFGQVGDGTFQDRTEPTQVQGLTNITAITASANYSLALGSDGTIWAWGQNSWRQLGDGTFEDRPEPVKVLGLTGITSISAGGVHALALRNDGTVWAWGYNQDGRLGDGTDLSRTEPVQVLGLTNITTISAGGDHSLAVRDGGAVWAWGRNDYGQIGDGPSPGPHQPKEVVGLTLGP